MGSGLNKCFISNQSLPEEIPVVVFPIIQEKGLSKVKITKNNKSHKVDQSGSFPVGHNCFYKFQGLYFTGTNKDGSKILLDETSHNKQSLILLCQYLYNEAFDSDCEDDTFNFKNILTDHSVVLGKNIKEEISFFSLDDEKILKSFNQTTVNEIFRLIIEYSEKNMIYVSDTVGHSSFKFSICLKSVFDFIIQESKEFFDIKFNEHMTHKINTRPPHTLSYDIMSDFFENLAINDSYNFDFSVYEVCTQSSGLPEMINIDNFHKGKELVQNILTLLNFQRFLNQNNITVEPISGYKQDYRNNAGKNYLKVVKVANKNVASFIKESNEQ